MHMEHVVVLDLLHCLSVVGGHGNVLFGFIGC